MTGTLLTICSANTCRSPLALAVLAHSLAGQQRKPTITLRSRGLDAVPGTAVCRQALQLARSSGCGTHPISAHRSMELDLLAVEEADLILTADRRVRSSVVKLEPRASGRTFTFREAAALARLAFASAPDDQPGDLAEFATALHNCRGLIERPAEQRSFGLSWPRLVVHAHDVPDAHLDRRVSHRVVAQALLPSVQELAHHLMTLGRQPR